MRNGDILLLENVRFHRGEEANDTGFANALAALGDLYVNDAFSCAHRAHASTEALAKLLPAAAGRNMEAELGALDSALGTPERPLAAVIGGAKISSKLELLTSLVDKVDTLVIGGAMANTFLQARGFSVGTSLCEPDLVAIARTIDLRASATACDLVLPFEVVVAASLSEGVEVRTVSAGEVPEDMMILDVGSAAVSETVRRLTLCKTVVWNGRWAPLKYRRSIWAPTRLPKQLASCAARATCWRWRAAATRCRRCPTPEPRTNSRIYPRRAARF